MGSRWQTSKLRRLEMITHRPIIQAALDEFGASKSAAFCLPIPNTTPQLFVAAGEADWIRKLLASSPNSEALALPQLPEPAEWALQLAAQAWCDPTCSDIEMDSRLATVFAQQLTKLATSYEASKPAIPLAAISADRSARAVPDGYKLIAGHAYGQRYISLTEPAGKIIINAYEQGAPEMFAFLSAFAAAPATSLPASEAKPDGIGTMIAKHEFARRWDEASQRKNDDSVTSEFLTWLQNEAAREGVAANVAWNAGVAWARASLLASEPASWKKDCITLTALQLRHALDFTAPDFDTDEDQREMEVSIAWAPAGATHTDKGDPDPAGYKVWMTDYPEEGSIPLDESPAGFPVKAVVPKDVSAVPLTKSLQSWKDIEVVSRIIRRAGKTVKQVRNPGVTARDSIILANYIVELQDVIQTLMTSIAASPAAPEPLLAGVVASDEPSRRGFSPLDQLP